MNLLSFDNKRLYFLDNLKAFIILLVVIFHIATGYTTWDLKWWVVNDIKKHSFFDLFVFETDVYLMPIMFMIAGYFAPMALNKKGIFEFCQSKMKRIVLPWIGGVLFIAPFITYFTFLSRTSFAPNYFSIWYNEFWGANYHQGPYWFLGILALFFFVLTLFYQMNPVYFKKSLQKNTPGICFFPLFILLTAVCFFTINLFIWCDTWINISYLFRIQPVRILFYFCYFGLGVYAWMHSWFTPRGYHPGLFLWVLLAIILLIVYLVYRINFTLMLNVPVLWKAGHAVIHSAFCFAVTMALFAIFQTFVDSNTYLWRRLSANSYTIYFIHPCIYIPIAYLIQKLDINIWLKWSGASLISVLLCFLFAEYLITPILSLVNNTKKTPFLHY